MPGTRSSLPLVPEAALRGVRLSTHGAFRGRLGTGRDFPKQPADLSDTPL